MRLLDIITQQALRSVAVVGLAKNAGKTVALNSLIRQAAERGLALGLSSVGYDGEKIDFVSRLAKPRIDVEAGTVIATAAATLERATAPLEIIATTNFVTALGEVMLVRAREGGSVEVAGPDSYREMGVCIARMQELGCELILVDGALDRVGGAAPTLTEGAILATGAVAGSSLGRILSRTLHMVHLFSLPEVVRQELRVAATGAIEAGRILLFTAEGERTLPFRTALGHAAAVVDCLPLVEPCYLIVPGAINESLLSELANRPRLCRNVVLICQDPTHIFSWPEVWQKYTGCGGRVEVLKHIRLLAVTVNPTAPRGRSYPPAEFAREIALSLLPLPVFDLFISDRAVGV
ncbi:MAG: hypothetical protein DDT34_00521 [Firmicutes bacterium]|nr:hypothetical protein [Bacillota bacterium]MBT9153062.1 hypothetical protein [Bacillota bacterium]